MACGLVTLAAVALLGIRHSLGPHLEMAAVAVAVEELNAPAGTAVPAPEERLFGAPLRRLLTLGAGVAALEPEAYRRSVSRLPPSGKDRIRCWSQRRTHQSCTKV